MTHDDSKSCEPVQMSPPRGTRRHGAPAQPRGWLRAFVERYGWRAYALPVLAVVTILALVRPAEARHLDTAAAHSAGSRNAPRFHPLVAPQAQKPLQLALGTDSTPCVSNALPQLILVSITEQRTWMCQRTTQVYSTLVTTGAANVGDGTPVARPRQSR